MSDFLRSNSEFSEGFGLTHVTYRCPLYSCAFGICHIQHHIGSYASYMENIASGSSTGFHYGEHVYGPVLAILLQLLASAPKA